MSGAAVPKELRPDGSAPERTARSRLRGWCEGFVEEGFEQPGSVGGYRGEARLQLVAEGRQLVYLRHDPPLLGEGREGNGTPDDLRFGDVWLSTALARRMKPLSLRKQKQE
jgi:hypothetical protein